MIDLHTHTLLSDGALIPSELVRRAAARGYRAMAITDHVDASNYADVARKILSFVSSSKGALEIPVIPGVELTHVPPDLIGGLIREIRQLGIPWVVVHGETLAEPVKKGTNRAAILGGTDLLAHPGLITEEEVKLAVEKGVFLEISARKGHSLANGHVATLAKRHGASLLLNTDAHAPSDLITEEFARKVALGCGLSEEDYADILKAASACVERRR